jgi:hypothetical protein
VTVSTGDGHTAVTDANGDYMISDLVPSIYTVTAPKPGLIISPSVLAVTVPPSRTGQDFSSSPYRTLLPMIRHPFDLPNGDFESGWSGWARDPASALAMSIATSDARSPTHSLLLGDPGYPQCSRGVPVGFARVTRQLQLPDAPGLAISFWYHIVSEDQMWTNDTGELLDTFEFAVDGGSPMLRDGSRLATKCNGPAADLGWKLYQGSLDHYRGQTVTLSFGNYSREPAEPGATLGFLNTYVYVDDVRISVP